jgi:predicted PurR-regulated permease PerM
MKSTRIASILVIVLAVAFILFYLRDMLIPFMLALIVWSLIRGIERSIRSLWRGDSKAPRWVTGGLAFLITFSMLTTIVYFLSHNIQGINEVLPSYQETLKELRDEIVSSYGIDLNQELNDFIEKFDISKLVGSLLNSLSSILGNAFLIIIYVLFLMAEERYFRAKIAAFFRKTENKDKAMGIVRKIDDSLSRYVYLKTLVSLVTGGLSYIALQVIGVDFAFFWAFMIFLLNYIPNIGSLIATLFPALIAALQFGDYHQALWVLLSVGVIQALVGNIVEPKVMGNTLNVSPLVVILSLVFWGFLWGIVGMILSVPIMVMLIIIFSQYPATRGVAILLSEKGEIAEME